MKHDTLELEKRVFHLKTVNEVSQEIVFLKDCEKIIQRLLLMIMGTYGASQGVAFLLNGERSAIEVFSERGLEESIEDTLIQLFQRGHGKSFIGTGHGLLLNSAAGQELDNELLQLLTSKDFVVFNSLKVGKKLSGGFALGAKLRQTPYTVDDLDLLGTLVNQGAVAIENARLHQQHLAKERVLKELEIAAKIQLSFLPSGVVTVPGMDLATVFLPAKEVGGDFYDFIALPDNKLGIVIADVVGKGIPAALYMALSRALFRACVAHEPADMTKAVLRTNLLIQQCSNDDFFVTLFYAIYDPATSALRYIRAGHNYPLLYKKRADTFLPLKGQGVALGMFDAITLEEMVVNLEAGDIVVFYTDGVTEALGSDKKEFGTRRLTRLIAETKNQSACVIAETLKNRVVEFEGRENRFDDLTIVVLKKTAG